MTMGQYSTHSKSVKTAVPIVLFVEIACVCCFARNFVFLSTTWGLCSYSVFLLLSFVCFLHIFCVYVFTLSQYARLYDRIQLFTRRWKRMSPERWMWVCVCASDWVVVSLCVGNEQKCTQSRNLSVCCWLLNIWERIIDNSALQLTFNWVKMRTKIGIVNKFKKAL